MKKRYNVVFQETSSFERRLEQAIAKLSLEGAAATEIPDGNGMILIREGTEEARSREKLKGAILYRKTKGDETFLVCLC